MKVDEETISEILVADSDMESAVEASDVDDDDDRLKNNKKPQQKMNHKLEQMADYQPGVHLEKGTPIFILCSGQPEL
jgi:hypothetical protein